MCGEVESPPPRAVKGVYELMNNQIKLKATRYDEPRTERIEVTRKQATTGALHTLVPEKPAPIGWL